MKYFSMFSGIGGFEIAINNSIKRNPLAEQANPSENSPLPESRMQEGGHRSTCVGFSEIDKYAIQIYQKHFPTHRGYGNATTIEPDFIPDFDFLCGGFPCQAFSIAGKRGGFNDTRGTLFFEIARILKEKHPRMFLLENVKGLLSHNDGRTFKTIISTLVDLGYGVEWQVLNSKNFGVPQNRERVFIVGHLGGGCGRKVFPIRESDKMANKSSIIANTITSNYWKGAAGSRPIPTDGTRVRRLTPTECERLQGFPDGWTEGISDSQRYKCLGNAVTVNVIQAIMAKMIEGERV